MATPRTGSSMLCDLLTRTGVAGRPTEYFKDTAQLDLSRRWGVVDPADYPARVRREGSTPNGVLGVKLMFTHLGDLVRDLRWLGDRPDADDLDVLRAVFPQPRFVWIYRDDVVAQGVSWAKAHITDEWVVGDARKRSDLASFDLHLVHGFVWQAHRLQIMVRRWFAYFGVQPFLVSYEHLSADPEGVTRGLLAFLDVPAPRGPIHTPMIRQADGRNVAWAARYRELARRLPPGFPALTDPLPAERGPITPGRIEAPRPPAPGGRWGPGR